MLTAEQNERKKWLVLEGTVSSNGKPVAAVGDAQLKVLRSARGEVSYRRFSASTRLRFSTH